MPTLLFTGLALSAGTLAYRSYAARVLRSEVGDRSRDPHTGVILGAEARTLLPRPVPGPASAKADPPSAVLMIHGFANSPRDFDDLGERLREAGHPVRLVLLDGHGTRPEDFARVRPAILQDQVAREYAELAAEHPRVDVIGFSMGGSLATLLAAEADPAPVRLVLMAPNFGLTHRWYYLLPPERWQGLLAPFLPYVVRPSSFIQLNDRSRVDEIGAYRVVPREGIDTAIALGEAAGRHETLGNIRSRVLLLHAEGDLASDPRRSAAALDAMRSAPERRHVELERSNHLLMWDYDREAVAAEILRFLED
jgi:carboxylesterase